MPERSITSKSFIKLELALTIWQWPGKCRASHKRSFLLNMFRPLRPNNGSACAPKALAICKNRKSQIVNRKLSGFTLTEMLAVIAIIAALATLLLPALSNAKAQARSISCLNNLKQLQAGWLMYVHDYHDVLTPNNSTKVGFIQMGTNNAW